ncbi:hypothetical protein B0H11DRAFT_2211097 [Mycena galericulata]|nr:hypothetical protein B0H11DRAFT_2211097 [Mycena galericulata]
MPADLTLEIKTIIAQQASLGTLASLCATSRAAHVQIMPRLYAHIATTHRDKDGALRTTLLLRTLASPAKNRLPNLGAHPATHVRVLKLWYSLPVPGAKANRPPPASHMEDYKKLLKNVEHVVHIALNRTAEYAVGGESQLRVFHWSSNAAIDITFPLLRMPPRFGRLEEIFIAPHDIKISARKGFKFLEIPGLKSLTYEESTPSYEICPQNIVEQFAKSLKLTPTTSPALTVLDVDITWATHSRLAPLEAAFNSLRLPSLRVARIKVFLGHKSGNPDFLPFLEAHPTLLDVSVNLGSKPLRKDALPLLAVFTGHTSDFIKVCDGKRPIRDLTISLFAFGHSLGNAPEPSENGRTVIAALGKVPHLRRLAIVNRPVHYHPDSDDDDEMYMQGMDYRKLEAIGKACPKLTHLELHLDSSSDLKGLAKLSKLKWLKAHVWMNVPDTRGLAAKMYDMGFFDGSEDEGDVFGDDDFAPADKIRRDINQVLPTLPNLCKVEVAVIGAREADSDSEWGRGGGDEKIEYEALHVFRILQRAGKREAVEVEAQN